MARGYELARILVCEVNVSLSELARILVCEVNVSLSELVRILVCEVNVSLNQNIYVLSHVLFSIVYHSSKIPWQRQCSYLAV